MDKTNTKKSEEALRYLKQCPRLQNMEEAALQALARLCEPVAHRANETLFKEHDVVHHIYLLCSGSVRFTIRHSKGYQIVLGYPLTPGHFFGEVAALSAHEGTGKKTRTATARALTDITAVKLTWEDLKKFVREHPQADVLLDYFAQDMADRLRRNSHDMALLTTRESRSLNESRKLTTIEECIRQLAGMGRSLGFLGFNVFGIALCLGFTYWLNFKHFDSAVGFIGMLVTVEALLVTTVILNSQSREEAFRQQRDDTEYKFIQDMADSLQHLHDKIDGLGIDFDVLEQATIPANALISPPPGPSEEPVVVGNQEQTL